MDKLGELMILVYVVLTVINVGAAWKRKWIVFCITKPTLMLVLMGVYLAYSRSALIWVVLALLFAWLGDVFLLSGDNRMEKEAAPALHKARNTFALGGFSFIMCHLIYIWTFFQISPPHFEWTLAIVVLVYILIAYFFYASIIRDFSGLDKGMKAGMGFYALVILTMSFSSLQLIQINELYTFIPFLGSLLFLLSDYLLAIGYKMDNSIIYRPWVMGSYASAQFLIIVGLILLGV